MNDKPPELLTALVVNETDLSILLKIINWWAGEDKHRINMGLDLLTRMKSIKRLRAWTEQERLV